MCPRLAIATSADWPALDPDSVLLLPALAALGIEAEPLVWSDPAVDWAARDGVLVRSVWDYFLRPDEFDAWVARVGALRPMWNPAPVVRWNSHKRYLSELAGRGVPVVDTLDAPAGGTLDLAGALAERGWDDAIFKPAVAG
ncbi:MAG: hypothetical protein QOJ07_2962, partial [Thermoleophilaceae bacterium]|nr:hypothetical protein [Thermoleophilaceae bacterium]